jgi:hypothetical protein
MTSREAKGKTAPSAIGPVEPAASSAMLPCTLRELLLYFLRLGTFGFDGPIALAAICSGTL